MGGLSADPLAYSPEAAARVLGISRRQVYRLIATGELAAGKAGRRTLIRRAELVRWLRSLPVVEPLGAA